MREPIFLDSINVKQRVFLTQILDASNTFLCGILQKIETRKETTSLNKSRTLNVTANCLGLFHRLPLRRPPTTL